MHRDSYIASMAATVGIVLHNCELRVRRQRSPTATSSPMTETERGKQHSYGFAYILNVLIHNTRKYNIWGFWD